MATQEERRARTRTAIIEAATAHFVDVGYIATSITDILGRAAVSRGALYHHFTSKEDVFASVFIRTSNRAIRRAAERVRDDASAFDQLIEGCLAWLDVVSDPATSRILFTEGPVALGWERCRTLEEASSLGLMRSSLEAAVASGEIQVHSIDTTARLINAVLAEAALTLEARSSADRAATAKDITALIRGLGRR